MSEAKVRYGSWGKSGKIMERHQSSRAPLPKGGLKEKIPDDALCQIDGCNSRPHGRGLCKKHYIRWWRYGDPNIRFKASANEIYDWLYHHKMWESDECLIWPFSRDANGYGQVNKDIYGTGVASRAMCMIANGPPPNGEYDAAHSCGNGHMGCINPNHLRWLPHDKNQKEMVEHGRSNRGERNPLSKISEAQAKEIYIRAHSGLETQRQIANDYGIKNRTVSNIKRRILWKHIHDNNEEGGDS